MTQEQGVSPGPNPPEFDSLDAATKLVTLQIGGSDIGFSGIAEDCFNNFAQRAAVPRQVRPRRPRHGERPDRRDGAQGGSRDPGIHERSPSARVLVLNYPAIFPDSGPGCRAFLPVSDSDVSWLRDKEKELNAMLAEQAAANGATLVDWYRASIGHDACKLPVIRWGEPLVPASPAAPVLIGMQAAAKLVVAAGR